MRRKQCQVIQKYLASFRGLPGEAWWLSLVVLINRSGSMVVFFLPLYLTEAKGFSILTAGRIISLWGLGSLFGSFAGGWLSDRWGSKAVQMISLAASGIGYLVLGAVDSLAAIACLAFVTAVLGDAFRPANIAAFTSLCAGETQARGFALMRLALNLGFSFGPAVGGILAAHSYRALFWIDGLTSLLAAAVLWAVVDDPDAHRVSAPKPKQAVSPWKDVPFLRFLGFLFLVGIVFFQLFGAWPLYLRQVRGFSERGIGFLLSLNAVLIVLFELPLIHRLERRNPLSVMTIGVAFMSAGFALLPAAGGYGFVLFTVLLWTIGEMLIFPLSATWIAGRACAANSGTTMGLFTLAFSLALCISPSAGALTYNRFGPSALWIGAGGLGFLVCAGLWRFNRSMHRERHENVSAEEAFAEPNLAEA